MRVNSESEMITIGEYLGQNLSLPAVIELIGDVGVGKTTFTRGLARGLGVSGAVTSPSFTISKRYAFPHGGELVHYDFYRLEDPGIMRDELSETLQSQDKIVIIEWGNDVSGLLPKNHITLHFALMPDGSREVSASGIPLDLWEACGKLSDKSVKNHQTCGKLHKKCEHTVNFDPKPVENSQKTVEKNPASVEKETKSVEKLVNSMDLGSDQTPNSREHPELKLYLDTSTDTCILRLNQHEYTRVGKYDLAEKIFQFIHERLLEQHADWRDITEITFFSGPGSFTGLRIGAAIVNALSDELKIPLFDHHGKRHAIILPDYGREANISQPRK